MHVCCTGAWWLARATTLNEMGLLSKHVAKKDRLVRCFDLGGLHQPQKSKHLSNMSFFAAYLLNNKPVLYWCVLVGMGGCLQFYIRTSFGIVQVRFSSVCGQVYSTQHTRSCIHRTNIREMSVRQKSRILFSHLALDTCVLWTPESKCFRFYFTNSILFAKFTKMKSTE